MKFRTAIVAACLSAQAWAGSGPLGIDHRWNYDNSGIWNRSLQKDLIGALILGEVGGALWEGGDTRLGRTFWQAIDSSVLAGVSTDVLKHVFTRARPAQTSDPNQWFQGSGHYSFPSGEVASVTAIVTPFVMEYHEDHPAVYALELLPLYDGLARMKVQGHWATDVLGGFALGTATSYWAHGRDSPFLLNLLPHGFSVGLRQRF